jgi:thiol-disulfide isomerase/thioredoxin
MKKLALFLFILTASGFICHAQISLVSPAMAKILPGEWAVVRDSTGHQYTYDEWTRLMASGRYNLRGAGHKKPGDEHQEYLIYSMYTPDGHRIITEAMKKRKPAESEQFHAGDVFKPFNERDINGQKFDLKKDKGKVYVINFWFINCPPCRAEIPDLNDIVEKYKDNKDVVFIAICLDDADRINTFLKLYPFNYHIIDNGRYIAEKYGVHLYPTNLVVNREGKVAYSSVSNQSSNQYWISKTIDEALLEPMPVAVNK